MPKRQPVDRTADIASRRLERAAQIIPETRNHLKQQRHNITLIKAASTDTSRPTGSHSDPTGQALLKLDHITTQETAINQALAQIETHINNLERAISRALGSRARPAADEPICYHAQCAEIVSSYTRDDGSIGYRFGGEYGGLCDTHRAKARRDRH